MPRGIVQSESGFLFIDASALKRLAGALRNVAPEAGREMRKRLRGAGEIIATKARENVLGIPTHSGGTDLAAIAASIKVKVSGVGVRVTAGEGIYEVHGRGTYVLTGLLEYGGKGKSSSWHPWGLDSITEHSHPYLVPALEESWPVVSELIIDALRGGVDAAFGETL